MATEDFTTYTETDPASDISVDSASQITVTTMLRNVDAYVYKDKTAAHFSGDFEHKLKSQTTYVNANGLGVFWAVTNDVDDRAGLVNGNKDFLCLDWYNQTVRLEECNGGSVTVDTTDALSDSTDYWFTVERDESVGDYGTIYCYVYSDAARTVLVDTLTITLHTSKKDFRYLFAVMSMNSGTTQSLSFIVSNLDLQEPSMPKLTMHQFQLIGAA